MLYRGAATRAVGISDPELLGDLEFCLRGQAVNDLPALLDNLCGAALQYRSSQATEPRRRAARDRLDDLAAAARGLQRLCSGVPDHLPVDPAIVARLSKSLHELSFSLGRVLSAVDVAQLQLPRPPRHRPIDEPRRRLNYEIARALQQAGCDLSSAPARRTYKGVLECVHAAVQINTSDKDARQALEDLGI